MAGSADESGKHSSLRPSANSSVGAIVGKNQEQSQLTPKCPSSLQMQHKVGREHSQALWPSWSQLKQILFGQALLK